VQAGNPIGRGINDVTPPLQEIVKIRRDDRVVFDDQYAHWIP